ncbi:hypothetical protein CWR45_08660 [Oceanobacillus chungangensis]|uniref:Uncharacterized protein n=1 Tax=Oceanobacillus chungangensis TaxID=1229152 RepID=A0A3D8PTH8_9BACI|nr:hypothetical protein CWR45_08660 [Oceanobacillus chungangensis]
MMGDIYREEVNDVKAFEYHNSVEGGYCYLAYYSSIKDHILTVIFDIKILKLRKQYGCSRKNPLEN